MELGVACSNPVKMQKPHTKRFREEAAAAVDSSKSSSSSRKPNHPLNANKIGSATTRSSSKYRGVTRHRWTGRYEAHLWDKNCWNQSRNKKGRQVYLGAYDDEDTAAHAYDLAALKYWGSETILNFSVEMYAKEVEEMQRHTREEYIASLRRKSNGFSRGVSKYRGVARHHHNGRWEARIGRVYGNKYLYLGIYNSQEEAAVAYDIAALQYRGLSAVTNFDMSNYLRCMPPPGHFLTPHPYNTSSVLKPNIDKGEYSPNTAASSSITEENCRASGAVALRDSDDDRIDSHDRPRNHLGYENELLQFCERSCSDIHQVKDDKYHCTMPFENTMNQSIQDQVTAAPPPHLQQLSANTRIATCDILYDFNEYSHELMIPSKPAMVTDAYDPADLYTAYHLDKLMGEYNELLQSPTPKQMLEEGTLATMVDALSDTASSSTTNSFISTVPMMSDDYMTIRPGGYIAELLNPQEEYTKYVDQFFDMVPGTRYSICSSDDLCPIQDLASCSISDIPCNNDVNPFNFSL